MDGNGRKVGGSAFLAAKLSELGIPRRRAGRILNTVFDEMSQALARGERVEFPFGYLKAEKGRGRESPLTIEHIPDEQGWRLIEGEKSVPAPEGWSLAPDKRSFANLWTLTLKPVKKPERARRRRKKVYNWASSLIHK